MGEANDYHTVPMRRVLVAAVAVAALLVGAGAGYFFGVSSQTNTARLTSFGVSYESCNRMGRLLCAEELSFLVTNTTQFANAVKLVNGSGFVFQEHAATMETSGYGASFQTSFFLDYYILGEVPPDSSCSPQAGIASETSVTIPLVNGFFPVSNMSITSRPPACSAPPVTS